MTRQVKVKNILIDVKLIERKSTALPGEVHGPVF